jgi:hypothetical protein
MNRRGFLKFLALGTGALALEQAIPFNRVWSFPKDIRLANVANGNRVLTNAEFEAESVKALGDALNAPNFDGITAATLSDLKNDVMYDEFFVDAPWLRYLRMGASLEASHPRMQATIHGISVPTDNEISEYA